MREADLIQATAPLLECVRAFVASYDPVEDLPIEHENVWMDRAFDVDDAYRALPPQVQAAWKELVCGF